MGTRDNKAERPYHIVYIKDARKLSDSAINYVGALARVHARLDKRHNRGETAEIWFQGKCVYSTSLTPVSNQAKEA